MRHKVAKNLASSVLKAEFFKYQALGNDMVVLDPARFEPSLTPRAIRLICDRHYGLGADGICYGPLAKSGKRHAMRFFNPDGSEAEKSGNGLRIFARYLWDAGYVLSPRFVIWMNEERIDVSIQDRAARTLSLGMGRLSFESSDVPVSGPARQVIDEPMQFGEVEFAVTAVSLGNPHCVIFVDRRPSGMARKYGRGIEGSTHFPQRINVQFVRVVDRHTIEIDIWERGAGYTLASGTSACATVGAAIKSGRCDSPVAVRMVGGSVRVEIDEQAQVTLTGSVEAVHQGRFAPDFVIRLFQYRDK